MDTNQIYELVNSTCQQAYGQNTIQATDTASLVSLGNQVFQTDRDAEIFLKTLTMRIGATIYSFRAYANKLGDMVLRDFEYGAILQKITVQLVDAEADPSADLVDGQSIDPWKIKKPKAIQKLFASRTPYMFHITIQERYLREAFTSPEGMLTLISMINGQMRNSIELSIENLGRACLGNFAGECAGTDRVVNLVSMYNATNPQTAVTATTAYTDPDFLRFAVRTIHNYSKRFTDMSQRFNDQTTTRHTPIADQRMKIYMDFESALETVVQYDAYHREMVQLGSYQELNFWQSNNAGEETQINVVRASDNKTITYNDVVGFLYDREALGIYKKEEIVKVTPSNAFGLYYNTVWHEQQLWFNDMSEQGIIFTLSDPTVGAVASRTTPGEEIVNLGNK